MKLYGVARAGMNAPDGYLSLNTMVSSSGAVTLSTMLNCALRALETPCGGKMIRWKLACTSLAERAEPSWNLMSLRILNVNALPWSAGFGISAQTSHTYWGLLGSSGFAR